MVAQVSRVAVGVRDHFQCTDHLANGQPVPLWEALEAVFQRQQCGVGKYAEGTQLV